MHIRHAIPDDLDILSRIETESYPAAVSDNPADSLGTCAVSLGAAQAAGLRPAAIAVHNDCHMLGHGSFFHS